MAGYVQLAVTHRASAGTLPAGQRVVVGLIHQ
jgi:hypothetical protein